MEAVSLPASGFVRQRQILEVIPISAATLWRRVAAGTFPAPLKLSDRITAWRVEDVRGWIESQAVPVAGPCVRRRAVKVVPSPVEARGMRK